MYKLVTAVLKEKNSSIPWSEVDISLTPIKDFFNNYISGYVVLTNDSLAGEHIVDYKTFITGNYPTPILNINFNQWLALIGNRILPTIKEPTFVEGEVFYSDAFKAGWKVTRAHPISPNVENYTDAQLTDGFMTKSGLNMQNYPDSFLVTMNGLLHYSYISENGIKVKDLTKSFYKSNKQEVGIFSFTDVGKVTQVPITLDNLVSVNDTDNYRREFCVRTNVDLRGKTVWASIGGYLSFDLDQVSVNNPESGLVYINLSNDVIAKRVAHSCQLIDLDDLGVFIPDFSPTSFNLDDFNTRLIMQRYLTLSQSFIIIIDTNNIEIEKKEIEYTGVVGVYKYPERISLPIFNQYGLLQHYLPTKLDNDEMGIITPAEIKSYTDYDTTDWYTTGIFSEDYRLRFNDRWHSLHALRFKSTNIVTA